MQTKTGLYMQCPVCDSPVAMTLNAKGRMQGICHSCNTAVFINRESAVQLAELKKRIGKKEELKLWQAI